MQYRRVMDPKELREQERQLAQADANAANIDYIAMMADIDIPTEEGGEYEPEV